MKDKKPMRHLMFVKGADIFDCQDKIEKLVEEGKYIVNYQIYSDRIISIFYEDSGNDYRTAARKPVAEDEVLPDEESVLDEKKDRPPIKRPGAGNFGGNFGPANGMYGRHGADNPNSKPVYQYTREKEFIKVHSSVTDAQRDTGIPKGGICECCNGKRSHYKGFIWSYKELDEDVTDDDEE